MNSVVVKVKPYAFTGTGAAIGAVAGGPIGLAVGAGAGALIDWWRRKHVLEAPVILPPSVSTQSFAPATLNALHLQRIKLLPPSPKPSADAQALASCRSSLAKVQAQTAAYKAAAIKKGWPAKQPGAPIAPTPSFTATPLQNCRTALAAAVEQNAFWMSLSALPAPANAPSSSASGGAAVDLSASGGFSF